MSKHFLSLISLLFILLYSCSNDTSNTKIPLSTNYIEVNNLYHEAIALNNIYKGNEAKEKLLEAVSIDSNFGAGYILLSTFNTNSVSETDKYYDKALSLKEKMNDVEKCFLDIRSSYRIMMLNKELKLVRS